MGFDYNGSNTLWFYIDIKKKEALIAANELTNALVEHLNVG